MLVSDEKTSTFSICFTSNGDILFHGKYKDEVPVFHHSHVCDMRFVDEAKIYVRAGDGGKGCVSFRREKYVPHGGPDGGDGGKGGDIVVVASHNQRTLLDLKYNQHHVAQRGGHGEGNNKSGKNGADTLINVPVGTLIRDAESGSIIADLTHDGQSYIVAKGGIGGKGNARFKSATNQAPRYAQGGIPGTERWICLELKLIADVGIIGLPNAGKSTFISRISAAKPKIADYPFTTLTPTLGVVKYGNFQTFVIADIPGLIEGAHRGVGLGTKFLRHVERTAILLHMIDISRDSKTNHWKDYEIINNELRQFRPEMLKKPQLVAFNKIDTVTDEKIIDEAVHFFKKRGILAFPISAVTGEGVQNLIREITQTIKNIQ